MAEVKNAFIKSKMNKDLDSRLLPSGEYRDGQNIQVSKSEGEDVGALENAVGNILATLSTGADVDFSVISGLTSGALKSIGVYADENTSNIFIFLTSNEKSDYSAVASNYIYSYNTLSSSTTKLVEGSFLNFSTKNPIYGINLLENLLFWTDNRNQPRKINIDNPSSEYTTEDKISVAKYNPYNTIDLYYISGGTPFSSMQDVTSEFLADGTTENPFYNKPLGVAIPSNGSWPGDPDYLEDKFVSFSYRYRFTDGEYSIMAPFTQEAFIPKQDGYFLVGDEDKAYVSSVVGFMENKVNNIGINIPLGTTPLGDNLTPATLKSGLGVSEIEILFKESDALSVKVLDNIKESVFKFNSGTQELNDTNIYKYSYQSRKPYKTLPESEIIRVYDKVPVRAFGQEVIANRIVYSNFQDKHTPPESINYDVVVTEKSNFSQSGLIASQTTSDVEYPEHTIKQNRNYQVGFVLSDRYGRQSTTILSPVDAFSKTQQDPQGNPITYGGSTFYHPYVENPLNNNIINSWKGDSIKISLNQTAVPSNNIRKPSLITGWNGLYDGDPTSLTYNPLGWYSYKVVVKQTEQEYYNVYLPGILNGYPDHSAGAATEPDPVNTVAFITLLGDNINKVPKDLTEVGPDQKQFRSSVRLFGRVTPPPIALPAASTALNIPYYPIINPQTVSTIATQDEMFKDDTGGGGVIGPPYGTVYQEDSNPYLVRLAQGDNAGNPIGSLQQANYKDAYKVLLGVYETNPRVSLLDIFYETSTSGLITDLNAVAGSTTSVNGFDGWNVVWNEGMAANAVPVVASFYPTIPTGIGTDPVINSLVVLTGVYDQTSSDQNFVNDWLLTSSQNSGSYRVWTLTSLKAKYHEINDNRNNFTFIFNVTNLGSTAAQGGTQEASPLQTGLTQEGILANVAPVINSLPTSPITVTADRIETAYVAEFSAVNGCIIIDKQKDDLSFSISNQFPVAGGEIPELTIDSQTGQVFETTNTASGNYSFTVNVTDSGESVDSRNIEIVFGQEQINSSFGNVKNKEFATGLTSSALYWGDDYTESTLIGGNNVPRTVSNTDSSNGRPAFAAPQNNVDLTLSDTGLASADEQSITIDGTDFSGLPHDANVPPQYYRWTNVNRKPKAYDQNLPATGNSLSSGTAYLKLDYAFKMFKDTTSSSTLIGDGAPSPGDAQYGLSWQTFLQYRPDSATEWAAAVDVEGQEIKFGAWQQNIRRSDRNQPYFNTGALNNSTQGAQAYQGAIDDTVTVTSMYPSEAKNLSLPTTSVASKVFVFGKDQGYDNENNNKLGEYRLMMRYPWNSTASPTRNVIPSGWKDSLDSMNPFGKNGAFQTSLNPKVSISFGDFYYADIDSQGKTNTAYAYLITRNGVSTVQDASQLPPQQEVFAREWALGYVTQFYSDSNLTNPQTLTIDQGAWFSYRPTSSNTYSINNGNENSWIGAIGSTVNENSMNGGGSNPDASRRWIAQFSATGKKIAGTSQPSTGGTFE
jgi:hypothetical protein